MKETTPHTRKGTLKTPEGFVPAWAQMEAQVVAEGREWMRQRLQARGPGWGKKQMPHPRVEWPEWKTGVFYPPAQAARQNGRGLRSDKVVVRGQGRPMELGRRRHLAACEHGRGRVRQKLGVSDGALWIGNGVKDQWPGAVEVLDFYHTSQPVWALGGVVPGQGERARDWGRNNGISYGTDGPRRSCELSPDSRPAGDGPARSSATNKTTLPVTRRE